MRSFSGRCQLKIDHFLKTATPVFITSKLARPETGQYSAGTGILTSRIQRNCRTSRLESEQFRPLIIIFGAFIFAVKADSFLLMAW
jgi:hypothetical protein